MRIAYVIADRGIPVFGNKGASIHVREMVNAFNSVGSHVTLVAGRCGSQDDEINANIVKVRTDQRYTNSFPLEGREKTRAREQHSLLLSDAIKTRLIELHGENPFDFIYERYCLFSTAGVRAARTLDIPSIVEVNSPLLLEQQRYRKLEFAAEALAVEKEVFANADALAAISDEVRDYIEARNAPKNRTYVLTNGVDITRFRPAAVLRHASQAKKQFTVGFVGSLKPWHGIEVLLKAFRMVEQKNKNVHLLIAGDGPLRQWIKGFVSGAGIEEKVTMTGWVSYRQLPALIRSMSVTVAPYPELPDFYFSPLKLYEYLAVGKPVIASDVGQIKRIVTDGDNGLLIKPGDAAALARRIEYLANDSNICEELGARARESVLDKTWINNAQRVLSIINPFVNAA